MIGIFWKAADNNVLRLRLYFIELELDIQERPLLKNLTYILENNEILKNF